MDPVPDDQNHKSMTRIYNRQAATSSGLRMRHGCRPAESDTAYYDCIIATEWPTVNSHNAYETVIAVNSQP